MPSDQELQATLPCGGRAPAGRCFQDLYAVVEQRIPDIGDGGRGIAGHVDPRS